MKSKTSYDVATDTQPPISEDLLQAWVDEALPPDQRAQVADWLAAHPQQAQRLEIYRTQRTLLRQSLAAIAEEPVPPELNLRRMVERMDEAEAGRSAVKTRQPRPRWLDWLLPNGTLPNWMSPNWASPRGAVAAACLLLGLGGILGGVLGGWLGGGLVSPGGMMTLGVEAAASYKVYAPDLLHPVEIRAENRALLARWAFERTGHALKIPELGHAGYRFMGGRVLASTQGASVLLMYDDDQGSRLVMLARSMQNTASSSPMQPLSVDDVQGFVWADGGLGYSLVGSIDAQALHPLADEVRRQIQQGVYGCSAQPIASRASADSGGLPRCKSSS